MLEITETKNKDIEKIVKSVYGPYVTCAISPHDVDVYTPGTNIKQIDAMEEAGLTWSGSSNGRHRYDTFYRSRI